MAGIRIKWLSDAIDAIRGNKAVKDSLEDVADSMDDLVDAGRDLGKSNDDIAKDLQKLNGRPFEEIRREVQKADTALNSLGKEADDTRRALDKVGDEGKTAGKKLKDGLDEAKNEAGQSGREAAASFGGGFEDVADFAQETLANALSGFGPLGAAAGIALAGVLGTALAGAQAAQEKLQAARERASELASALYQNDGKLPMTERLEEMFRVLAEESGSGNALLNLIDGWTDFGSTLDAVKRSSELTGIGVKGLLSAMSGDDLASSEKLLDAINGRIKELESNVETAWAWDENLRGLREVRDETEKNIEAQKLSAAIIDETGAAGVKAAADQAEATRTATEDIRNQVAEISTAWQNAATDAADYFVQTEDGATTFDWSSYLTDAEETLAAANEYKARIVTLPDEIAAEAERIFAERGAIDANAYTAAYEGASEADRGRFSAAAQANGQAAADAAAQGLVGQATQVVTAWTPPNLSIPLNLQDNTEAQMAQIVRNLSGRSVTVGVGTVLKPNYGGGP
jgi:hypothetical protein